MVRLMRIDPVGPLASWRAAGVGLLLTRETMPVGLLVVDLAAG